MFELAVHNEEVDEFYLGRSTRQAWKYRLLDDNLQKDVMRVIVGYIVPFLEFSRKETLWKGDAEYLFRIGLKALFAAIIHLGKNEQDMILNACSLSVGDSLEWKRWKSFVTSFWYVCLRVTSCGSLVVCCYTACVLYSCLEHSFSEFLPFFFCREYFTKQPII